LDEAVAAEMMTFKDEWEATLDELETESATLLVCFVVASSIPTKLTPKGYLSFKVTCATLLPFSFLS
jgi:hypothetical protein